MVISYLYVQTVTHQCFCFPNSQWGATAHDTTPVCQDKPQFGNFANLNGLNGFLDT